MKQLRNFTILFVLFLSACTVSFFPEYDEDLYNGLDSANEQAQTLFSAVSNGASPGSFSQYEANYNATIGKFGALLTRANTRPQPKIGQLAARRLESKTQVAGLCAELRAQNAETNCTVLVTPYAITEITETLTRMRDQHKSSGLGPLTVEALKGDYEISIEQAMTVEAALQ